MGKFKIILCWFGILVGLNMIVLPLTAGFNFPRSILRDILIVNSYLLGFIIAIANAIYLDGIFKKNKKEIAEDKVLNES